MAQNNNINQISEVVVDDLKQQFNKDLQHFSNSQEQLLGRIKILINKLISKMEQYEAITKNAVAISNFSLTAKQLAILKKDLIYSDFFELQNLMNLFIGQKLIMTYVQTDPLTGQRTIKIFNNTIENIAVTEVNNYGRNYVKLGYDIGERYQQLKNSLSTEENEGLQLTAAEVEARYSKHKGRILWKLAHEWYGYKLYNRGPINEAFVDFYIKEVQLKNSLVENIHQFMLSENPKGVRWADNANGFLIGDVQLDGLQFAVKGAYGSPQNFTLIIQWLKKIQEANFSSASIEQFIERFREIEEKKATTLVKPMVQRSIDGMARYHGDKLLNSYLKI